MGKKKKEGLHPTDVFRKQERKKEIKKSKFQKAQVCRRTHARTHAAREPCETLTGAGASARRSMRSRRSKRTRRWR